MQDSEEINLVVCVDPQSKSILTSKKIPNNGNLWNVLSRYFARQVILYNWLIFACFDFVSFGTRQ